MYAGHDEHDERQGYGNYELKDEKWVTLNGMQYFKYIYYA